MFCFISCFQNPATAGNKSRHEHTPSDNPQREDLIMKPKKEHAELAQREKKIASSPTLLEATYRIWRRERIVVTKDPSPQNQSTRRIAELAMERSPIRLRPFCKVLKRARNKAMFQMIDPRNNHHFSPAIRRSPSNITTLPASRAPANTRL
jgi:hypothetical protein